jgi:hypothetical protein
MSNKPDFSIRFTTRDLRQMCFIHEFSPRTSRRNKEMSVVILSYSGSFKQMLPTVPFGYRENISSKAWARICGPTLETRAGQILISTFKFILSDLAVILGPLRLFALILISKVNFVDPAG